jgi:hypothetical protein
MKLLLLLESVNSSTAVMFAVGGAARDQVVGRQRAALDGQCEWLRRAGGDRPFREIV